MGGTWEGHTSIRIRYYKSCENPYQVLQVMQESISGTIRKSHALHLNVQWNRRFVWWNHYHHSTKLYRKKISLVCCRLYCYSCCTLITIQTATNLWYFPVQLCTCLFIDWFVSSITWSGVNGTSLIYDVFVFVFWYHLHRLLFHSVNWKWEDLGMRLRTF